jgi:hypothetical protein
VYAQSTANNDPPVIATTPGIGYRIA